MKIGCFLTILFIMIPLSALGPGTDDPGSPSIFVPQPSFQFEPVVSGQKVSHDYIVQNKGTAPLEITRIKTG